MPPQEVPFPVDPPVIQPPPQVQRNWLERAGDTAVDAMRSYTPPEVRGIAKDVASVAPYLSRGMDFQDAGEYAVSAKERFLDAWSEDISRRQQAKNSASASLDAMNSIGAYLLGMTGTGGAVRAGKHMLSQEQLQRAFGREALEDTHHGGKITSAKIRPEKHGVSWGTRPQDFRWDVTTSPDVITPKPMSWESLKDTILIPLMTDRLRRGHLTRVGPDEVDVMAPGGIQYMGHTGAGDPRFWAMAEDMANKWTGKALRAQEEHDLPVRAVTQAMSGQNLDQSISMGQTVLQRVRKANLSKAELKEFDDAIRKKQEKGKLLFPDWPGLNDPDIDNYVDKLSLKKRGLFVQQMDTKTFRELGFPDIPEIRASLTVPELMGVPVGTTGHRVGTPDLHAPYPPRDHHNYDTSILLEKGTDVGTLPPLHATEVFAPYYQRPDIAESAEQGVRNISQLLRVGSMKPDSYVKMDEQLIETLMKSLERQKP